MPAPSKILVVDDEPKAVNMLRSLLTPEGYQVLTAHSGPEALEVAQRESPDVVLLDVMMPGMDGYEVCARLRANPFLANIPVLMLTALDDRDSKLRGLEAGADDFLPKPYDSLELRARLRTITRLNRFRQLYEERARLEAAIAHAPYGIVLAELDGTILQRNQAFTRMLAPGQPAQGNFYAHFPASTALLLRQQADKPGVVTPLESPLNFAAAADAIVEVSCALVPWQGRGIMHFVVRNLTERKRLEQQLQHSQRIELLGQLAGSAIHDVNNVLGAIQGSAQLLEMKGGADLNLHLGQIVTSTQRGASILRQLLMFARGDEDVSLPANPASVTAEVAHMVKETFGRMYTVEFKPEEDLPQVMVDATQFHQIVMNLCVNARDAMPDGGRLTIGIARRDLTAQVTAVLGDSPPLGAYVGISVRDNGTGIPPHVLPKLFDPFFTTKPKGKGTGLGLATVIRLVRRQKGFVLLETEVGVGTCFTCCFPVYSRPGH